MRLSNYFSAILVILILFISCDINKPDIENSSGEDIFHEEGKLTLYKLSIPFGDPNHIVFGDSIILDASAFISSQKDVKWEIYYSPNYEITAATFDNSWLSWHDEFIVRGAYEFIPEGSGSYLIKAIPEGSNKVLVDGILNVTRSPLDTGVAPVASLNTVTLPKHVGDQMTLNANGSWDSDSTELLYRWFIYKVNPNTYMYNRNEKAGGIYYQEEDTGIEWNHSFTESGLYYIRLIVQDPIYDLARDNETAIKYTTIYVRPAGENVDLSVQPNLWSLSSDSDGKMTITMGDFYWYEVVRNSTDYVDVVVLYKLTFHGGSGFYYKYYYAATLADALSVFGNWPPGTINTGLSRNDLKNAEIGTLTPVEQTDLISFSVTLYGYDSEGERYSF